MVNSAPVLSDSPRRFRWARVILAYHPQIITSGNHGNGFLINHPGGASYCSEDSSRSISEKLGTCTNVTGEIPAGTVNSQCPGLGIEGLPYIFFRLLVQS